MAPVFWKELGDYFGSRRFFMLVGFIAVAGLWAAYTSTQAIQGSASNTSTEFLFLRLFTSSSGVSPSFLFFVSLFGPLLGLALGFDAINSERARGTLSRLLAQPISRDSLINGKFLAGITVLSTVLISLVLIVLGLGIFTLGFPPTGDEAIRILIFVGTSVVYVGFWLAVSVLFSLLFERAVVSALASLGVWLLLAIFIFLFAGAVADLAVPEIATPEQAARHFQWEQRVERFSPAFLYQEATSALLNPSVRSLGPIAQEDLRGVLPNPVPLRQSIGLVWPHLTALLAMAAVIFAIAYQRFLREEIRS